MKPECHETLREIERFLDGEMGPDERQTLDRHLSDCHPCSERADFKRHLKELIASSCGCDEVPSDLRERVMRLIEGTAAPPA